MKKTFKLLWLSIGLVTAVASHAVGPDGALTTLRSACPGLKKFAADISFTAPVKEPASLDAQRDRKWKDVFTIKASISDAPVAKFIRDYKAQGQSCYFSVEAGKAKEITVAKAVCQRICTASAEATGGVAYYRVGGHILPNN